MRLDLWDAWRKGGSMGACFERKTTRRDFVKAAVGGLLPTALAACIPEPTGPGIPRRDPAFLSVRHAPPTRSPQTGAHWLNVNTVARDSILYVPDTYDHAVPTPLLVTLHGRGGAADNWTGFYPKCDARGMVMLAVESRTVSWDRTVTGEFGPDVGYINEALGVTFDQCNVDPTHIALAGFSDGASYTLSLGPSNGEFFTHLIAFSPGFSAPGEVLRGRPPIWMSHGLSDPVFDEDYTFREILQELRRNDYIVQYTAFDGGHEVPAEISNAALDWFVA